jgi:hypothetical protein
MKKAYGQVQPQDDSVRAQAYSLHNATFLLDELELTEMLVLAKNRNLSIRNSQQPALAT